jgi:molecular chaperone DnaK (HSP70)
LEKLEESCQDTLEWMEKNEAAEKSQLDEQKKKLEHVVKPIMTKMYQEKVKQAMGGGGAGKKKKSRR